MCLQRKYKLTQHCVQFRWQWYSTHWLLWWVINLTLLLFSGWLPESHCERVNQLVTAAPLIFSGESPGKQHWHVNNDAIHRISTFSLSHANVFIVPSTNIRLWWQHIKTPLFFIIFCVFEFMWVKNPEVTWMLIWKMPDENHGVDMSFVV